VTILEADGIRKSYRGKEVLRGISLAVHPGETVAVLGQNGAGKTTLIRILGTLLRQDSGRVLMFGKEPFSRDSNTDLLRQQIGYVGQDSERSAYGRLTVRENLIFFGRLMGLRYKTVQARIAELAQCFEFENKLNTLFMNLSGGQKQTVVIMRALLHNPQLVFLDEPTKGLDPVHAQGIRCFLKRYVSGNGKTMLLTSHILQDVEYLADRVAFLRNGTIAYMDTPEHICSLPGYSDVIEITGAGESVMQRVSKLPDIRILAAGNGKLVLGVNDFLGTIMHLYTQGGCEFSHRKVNLEDAYLYFTSSELNGITQEALI
jgi:ABC-2 type transport system ATP-binding protein